VLVADPLAPIDKLKFLGLKPISCGALFSLD